MEYGKPVVLAGLGDSAAFRSELRRSCKDSSSASIRLDISFIFPKTSCDISVNLLSNCLRTVSTNVVSSNGLEIANVVSPDSSLLADSFPLALAGSFVGFGEFEARGVSGLSAEAIPFVGTLRGVALGGMG